MARQGEDEGRQDETIPSQKAGGRASGSGMAPGMEFDRYLIQEEIGRGGMGVVYKALDQDLGRQVALKVISPSLAADASFRSRFKNEARSAAKVDSPFVLPVYEAGESEGTLFMASRYVPGGDLKSVIASGLIESTSAASLVITQLAAGLDAAHGRGLVHRDVKPANVLVERLEGGAIHSYLSDFGLSKALEQSESHTASGEMLGSANYMAPEQVKGESVSAATDQYSLACVAFELLYGYPAFERESRVSSLMAHLTEYPAWPEGGRIAANDELKSALAKGLALDPADRFANCTEFSEAVRRAIPDPESLEPNIPPTKARRRTGRGRLIVALGAFLALGGVLALMAALLSGDGGDSTTATVPAKQRLLAYDPVLTTVVSTLPDGSDPRPLTFGTTYVTDMTTSDDGSKIAFYHASKDVERTLPNLVRGVDVGGIEQSIRVVRTTDGRWQDIGVGIEPQFSPEGDYVCFVHPPPPMAMFSQTETECAAPFGDERWPLGNGDLAMVSDDGTAIVNQEKQSETEPETAYLVDIENGERTPIAEGEAIGYLDDRKAVLIARARPTSAPIDIEGFDLYKQPLPEGEGEFLAYGKNPSISKDGSTVYFVGTGIGGFKTGEAYALDISSGNSTDLGKGQSIVPTGNADYVFLMGNEKSAGGFRETTLVGLIEGEIEDLGKAKYPTLSSDARRAVIEVPPDPDRGQSDHVVSMNLSNNTRLNLDGLTQPQLYEISTGEYTKALAVAQCGVRYFANRFGGISEYYVDAGPGVDCNEANRVIADKVSHDSSSSRKALGFSCESIENAYETGGVKYRCTKRDKIVLARFIPEEADFSNAD